MSELSFHIGHHRCSWSSSLMRLGVRMAAVLLIAWGIGLADGFAQSPDWASRLDQIGDLMKDRRERELFKSGIGRGEDVRTAQEIVWELKGQIPESERQARAELAYWQGLFARGEGRDSVALRRLLQGDSLLHDRCGDDCTNHALIHAELGKVYYNKGDENELAKFHLETALNEWLLIPGRSRLEDDWVLDLLGKLASRLGEHQRALDMLSQVRTIRAAVFGSESFPVARAEHGTGNIYYRMDRYTDAAAAYQRAIDIVRKAGPEYSSTLSSLLINLAATQDQLQQFQSAIDNAREAIRLLKQTGSPEHPFIITTYGNIGLMYQRMGSSSKAGQYLKQAAELALRKWGPRDLRTGQILGDHAYWAAENGQLYQALDLLQQALHTAAPAVSPENWGSNPSIEEVLHQELFRNVIAYKADILYRLALSDSTPVPLLRLSLECYDLFAAGLDQIWLEYSDPGDKLYLNRNGINEYEKAIRCAAQLEAVTGEVKWRAKIFEFMERGKCQVMLESIRRSRASYLADIPEDLRERSTQLREAVQELNFQVHAGNAPEDSLRLLRGALIARRLELDRFSDSLELAFPGFADMTGHKSLLSLSQLQNRLDDPRTCLLEYFVGDSSLYVLGVHAGQTSFRKSALEAGFADSLAHFLSLVQYPHPTRWRLREYGRIGEKLYNLLLGPELRALPDSVDRLRIIPDGMLSLLPFDALPSGPAPARVGHHGQLPLLIYDFRVSYAGAATLLASPRLPVAGEVECLGFAWNDDRAPLGGYQERTVGGQPWPALPGAGEELAAISYLLSGQYFTGQEASESSFKSLAGDYGLLHLALHGNSGGEEPYIVFPEAGDSTEDGVLRLHELYNLPLRARLAVLSACETGSGSLERGEGVMSVASGFGTAGCPAVVMSVWPVDDDAGSFIMRHFYENLVEGQPVDEALHAAKLSFIRSGGSYRSAPYYWAPFIALGDMEAIPLKKRSHPRTWWWLAGGLLVLGLGGWYLRRRYRPR